MLRRVWIWTLVAVLMCIGDSYGATVSAPALQVVSCYGASDYDGAGNHDRFPQPFLRRI